MGGLLERRVSYEWFGQPLRRQCATNRARSPPGQEGSNTLLTTPGSNSAERQLCEQGCQTYMAAPAPAPAPAAALSQEEQFYAGLGGRCRRGFFKDVAWDEACLAAAIDAFRVPDRRCYVPDDCGPYEHRLSLIHI